MAPLVLWMALQEIRVTLELRDVPLSEAARQALGPFGQSLGWIPPEAAARRVNLSLKGSGYFQALDRICDLADLPRLDSPFHRSAFQGLTCGNVADGCRTIAVLDLSSDARLVLVRRQRRPDDVSLELTLALPPGPARPFAQIQGLRLNGLPRLPALEFTPWSDGNARPRLMLTSSPAPIQATGESFQVAGELVLQGRRLHFATDAVLLLPEPSQTAPEKSGFLHRYWKPLCLAGMALAAGLIVRCIRSLRAAQATRRP